MTELRPCGRPSCRLCYPRPEPVRHDGDESFASLLLGAAILFAAFVLAFVLIPALAL